MGTGAKRHLTAATATRPLSKPRSARGLVLSLSAALAYLAIGGLEWLLAPRSPTGMLLRDASPLRDTATLRPVEETVTVRLISDRSLEHASFADIRIPGDNTLSAVLDRRGRQPASADAEILAVSNGAEVVAVGDRRVPLSPPNSVLRSRDLSAPLPPRVSEAPVPLSHSTADAPIASVAQDRRWTLPEGLSATTAPGIADSRRLPVQPRTGVSASTDDGLAGFRFLQTAQRIPFGSPTAVPFGYYQLCRHDPAVCQASRGSFAGWSYQTGVQLNQGRLKQLISVNAEVNRSIREASDRALYKVADHWVVGPKAGDCEDFVLTKKARLIALGWPSSALLVALARTRAGEEHAVLLARTDRGDLVLDSLKPGIRGWQPSVYRWTSVQSPTDLWVWHRVGDAPPVQQVVSGPQTRIESVNAAVTFE